MGEGGREGRVTVESGEFFVREWVSRLRRIASESDSSLSFSRFFLKLRLFFCFGVPHCG